MSHPEIKKERPFAEKRPFFFVWENTAGGGFQEDRRSAIQQYFQHLHGGAGDGSSRPEDGSYTCFIKEIIVLGGNHSAGNDDNVRASQFFQLLDYLRDQSLVPGGQGGNSHYVHIVFYCLACSLGRRLEQRAHVYVETTVGISGCYHFGSTVVPVLPHFGNHDTRLPAFFPGKLPGQSGGLYKVCIFSCF